MFWYYCCTERQLVGRNAYPAVRTASLFIRKTLTHTPEITLHADDVTSARVQSFDMFDLYEVINHDYHTSQSPKQDLPSVYKFLCKRKELSHIYCRFLQKCLHQSFITQTLLQFRYFMKTAEIQVRIEYILRNLTFKWVPFMTWLFKWTWFMKWQVWR